MLKHILLASAFIISAPALAQNQPQTNNPTPDTNAAPGQPQTAPVPQAPLPTSPAPQTTPAPTSAVPAAPASSPMTADSQTQTTAPTPAAPAPNAQAADATPANAGAQVAEVVNGEFGTYDKNKNGSLSKAEFGTWMTALRTKADPSLKDDAANKAWVAQAFSQADTDKSGTVSKDELTNFLSQGSGHKAS